MNEQSVKNIRNLFEALKSTLGVNVNEHLYTLEQINYIWDLSPFKVGDRVVLTKTPEISETVSWGWLSAKHFLVQGATGGVVERSFRNGKFCFGIHFDDESWISSLTKEINPIHPDKRAQYWFSQDSLSKSDSVDITNLVANKVILSEKEKHILEHTLGFNSKNPGYRNYFAADKNSDDWGTLQDLCERKLMYIRLNPATDFGNMTIFAATDLSKSLLGINQ